MFFLVGCFQFFLFGNTHAQPINLQIAEDSLAGIYTKIAASKNDDEKNMLNTEFKNLLLSTLKNPNAINYPFDKLKIGKLSPEDQSFKMFGWNIPNNNLSNQYYCFVLVNKKEGKENTVIELVQDTSSKIEATQQFFSETNWYGALYYQLIPISKKNKKTYIILGWDGNNALSTKKVIETITVSKKGVKFGSPIFFKDKKFQKRVSLEFGKESNVLLRYYPEFKSIIFNHLVPLKPSMEGNKNFYAPDLTFDGYVFDGKKWIFKENIEFNAPKNQEEGFEKPTSPDMNKKRDSINPLTGKPY